MTSKTYDIYSVKKYSEANNTFIKNNKQSLKKNDLIKQLKINNFFHFRIHKNEKYILFGDIDNLNKPIENFKNDYITFFFKYYNLTINEDEIMYTQNNKKNGSYHFSIPKFNCNTNKLKEIHKFFVKIYKNYKSIVDTTIYSEHWFRCPNQSKGSLKENEEQNQHKIIVGKISDFIIAYIPKNSTNIDYIQIKQDVNCDNINNDIEVENNTEINNDCIKVDNSSIESNNIIEVNSNNIIKINDSNNTNIISYDKEILLSKTLSNASLYKKIFDECYKQERFEQYEYWKNVGMAIKNTFENDEEAFELFNYYSTKGKNYEGYEKTKFKFLTFTKKNNNGITVATIHFYALEDNKPKFIEIMNKNTFELGQTDMCKYIKILVGYKFVYKKKWFQL
jgi:hypothetical protein